MAADWPPRGQGLPIGALTSQLFAGHVYLNAFDHFVKRELGVPGYLRYMDDLFFFGDSRARLRSWRTTVGAWLGEERHLRLKVPEARILSCAGHLDALGHRIGRDGVRPRQRMLRELRARMNRYVWQPVYGPWEAGAAPAAPSGTRLEASVASSVGGLLFG